jgi:hypothetical protein
MAMRFATAKLLKTAFKAYDIIGTLSMALDMFNLIKGMKYTKFPTQDEPGGFQDVFKEVNKQVTSADNVQNVFLESVRTCIANWIMQESKNTYDANAKAGITPNPPPISENEADFIVRKAMADARGTAKIQKTFLDIMNPRPISRESATYQDCRPIQMFNVGDKMEVFHVGGYNYLPTEATQVCKDKGASVATVEQVKQAFNDGAEWCSWGHTRTFPSYPMQTTDCGIIGTNIMSDFNPSNPGVSWNGGRYGVNCWGVKPPKDSTLSSNILPFNPLKNQWNNPTIDDVSMLTPNEFCPSLYKTAFVDVMKRRYPNIKLKNITKFIC